MTNKKESVDKEFRNSKDILVCTHKGEIRLLNVKIPCGVLDNEMRIIIPAGIYLSSNEEFSDEDRLLGTAIKEMLVDLSHFPSSLNLETFVTDELRRYLIPVKFSYPVKHSKIMYGYDARVLSEICMVYIIAAEAGVISSDQMHLVDACKKITSGLVMIGRRVAGYSKIGE